MIVAGAEATHLITGIVGDGGIYGEGLHHGAVGHGGDVEDMGPWFGLYRTFFATGYGVGAVFLLFEQEVGFAKYKPI